MDPCREQAGTGNWLASEVGLTAEAIEFVRFCYRRRRVGWPELYDEMSAVAARGLFQGWTYVDLGEHGIGFCLDELPRLAAVASRIAREERGAPDGSKAQPHEVDQGAPGRRPARRLQAVAALG